MKMNFPQYCRDITDELQMSEQVIDRYANHIGELITRSYGKRWTANRAAAAINRFYRSVPA